LDLKPISSIFKSNWPFGHVDLAISELISMATRTS
jgi:hypothetical protein